MHNWSDGNVDWAGINAAARFIGTNLRRWGRVGVRDYKEKYGCYDGGTEVLTKDGFKFFKDVDIEKDEFATLQDGENLVYHKASYYHDAPYSGKMYHIKTMRVDLLVTPNHNLYIASADKNGGINNNDHKEFPFQLENFERLYRKPKKFKIGARWSGNQPSDYSLPEYTNTWNPHTDHISTHHSPPLKIPIVPWLQFLGWYVAEGNAADAKVTLSLNGTSDVEANKVKAIVDKCGFECSVSIKSPSARVTIYSKQLVLWLLENCGHLAPNKKVPLFIKELSPELIEEFLTTLYEGDGWKSKTANSLSTASKQLADDTFELLLKAGYCGSMTYRDRSGREFVIDGRVAKCNHPEYQIRWLKTLYHTSSNSHDTTEQIDEKEKLVDYDGRVYCVTVPGNILYVRRGGRPVWCGNTVRVYLSFGWATVSDLTHPGWCYIQYKSGSLMHRLTYARWPRPFFSLLNKVVVPYHVWLYRCIYSRAVKKWPHLTLEIINGSDYHEFLMGISPVFDEYHEKHWSCAGEHKGDKK